MIQVDIIFTLAFSKALFSFQVHDHRQQRENLVLALEIAEDLLEAEGKDMASKDKAEFVDLILDLLAIDEDPAKVKKHIKNVINIAPHLKRKKTQAG